MHGSLEEAVATEERLAQGPIAESAAAEDTPFEELPETNSPAETRLRRGRKGLLVGLLLLLASGLTTVGGWWWFRSDAKLSTDNAYVRGDITSLTPKVSGYVISVEVQDNQAVQPGEVLFRIDDRDYRARLAQAEANVAAARARLGNAEEEIGLQHALVRQAQAQRRAAEADLRLARRNNERRRALVERGFVSRATVDESEAARSRAEENLSASSATVEAQQQRIDVLATQRQAAVAALAQVEAALDLARIDLENTVVRAPVSGVVGNRRVRVGRLVAPGTPQLDIVPAEPFIIANFKETQLERIQPGQAVRIRIDAYPDMEIAGVVDSFAPASGSEFSLIPVDSATGSFVRVVQRVSVKIRFPGNPLPGRLVPGLSARVEIEPRDPS